jgi:hypothetical protein
MANVKSKKRINRGKFKQVIGKMLMNRMKK